MASEILDRHPYLSEPPSSTKGDLTLRDPKLRRTNSLDCRPQNLEYRLCLILTGEELIECHGALEV